ncbi:hypothetical protein B0H13DRAFT_1902061 [Mycena leptocephala]|nr:hypothetical protein B0H13DRAFT_1902061 [Mycena leptocephala]
MTAPMYAYPAHARGCIETACPRYPYTQHSPSDVNAHAEEAPCTPPPKLPIDIPCGRIHVSRRREARARGREQGRVERETGKPKPAAGEGQARGQRGGGENVRAPAPGFGSISNACLSINIGPMSECNCTCSTVPSSSIDAPLHIRLDLHIHLVLHLDPYRRPSPPPPSTSRCAGDARVRAVPVVAVCEAQSLSYSARQMRREPLRLSASEAGTLAAERDGLCSEIGIAGGLGGARVQGAVEERQNEWEERAGTRAHRAAQAAIRKRVPPGLAANQRLPTSPREEDARSSSASALRARKERGDVSARIPGESASEIHAIDTGGDAGGRCVGEAEESSSDASTIAIRCDQRCGHGVDEELGALAQRGAGAEDGEREGAEETESTAQCDLVQSEWLIHSETAGINTKIPRMHDVAVVESKSTKPIEWEGAVYREDTRDVESFHAWNGGRKNGKGTTIEAGVLLPGGEANLNGVESVKPSQSRTGDVEQKQS